jgi:hypothetical protein
MIKYTKEKQDHAGIKWCHLPRTCVCVCVCLHMYLRLYVCMYVQVHECK